MPIILTANKGEKDVLIKIAPVTASGKPSSIEAGTLSAVVTEGDGVVEPIDDSSVKIITGEVGVTKGTITGDADLGEGIVAITDTFEVTVVEALADNLGATGELVDKIVINPL
jgi:hypothetical protein